MSEINTSRAKNVTVRIYDYDNLPLSATYSDKTDPLNIIPIDLTDYKFEFVFKIGSTTKKTYSINAGDLTSTFINKTGADLNIIAFEAMWEDLRPLAKQGLVNRLIQVVTDTTGNPYVHIVYNIDARQY